MLLAVGAAIALAIVFISVGEHGRPIAISGASETQRVYGGIEQQGDELGDSEAPVAISYFTDLQCDRCAAYHRETIVPLVEDEVRGGDVRISLSHFSTAQNETSIAAFAARAAGQQAHEWQYAHLFFENLDQAIGGRVTEDLLRGVAAGVLEFDDAAWERAIDSDIVRREIEADAALAIDLLLPAEPALVVEGPRDTRKLLRSPSLAEVEAAIEAVR